MLRIRVTLKDRVVGELAFDQPRVRIGRAPDSELHLDNLALSRRHAELVRGEGGWRLRDLGSRNGVHVNGLKRTRHNLNSGDVIVIGKYSLEVRIEGEEALAREESIADLEGFVAQGRTIALGRRPKAPPGQLEREASVLAHLSVGGPVRGQPSGVFVLDRDAFHVGSDPRCRLQLRGLLTPRNVAMIVRGRSGFCVVNVSPRAKGVYVNGRPVSVRSPLRDGDRLEFVSVCARFHEGPPR